MNPPESIGCEQGLPTEPDADTSAPKPMHFGLALVLSFLIFNAGFVISQTLRWTDHLHGFRNGVFHISVFGFGWCFWFLPWSLIVYLIYRKRADKSRRTQWILAPAWLVLILMIGGLAFDPPSAKKRFERLAKVDFPKQAADLNTQFSGGGLVDYGDTYYFRTSSGEIDRIIREKEMLEDVSFGKYGMISSIIKPLPGSPDFKGWDGAKQFRWMDSQHHWFMYLVTDAEKTQAYIFVGCT